MSEIQTMLIGFLKCVPVLLAGMLYSMGGRDDDGAWYLKKFMRRFVAPIVLVGSSIAINLGFGLVDNILYYCIASCLAFGFIVWGLCSGYGAVATADKVFKRLKVAGIVGLAYVVMGVYSNLLSLGALAVIFSCSASVLLGVFDNLEASQEELVIGLSYFLLFPFFV